MSALVHSSTLVTAGVYVLVRFSSCIVGGWFMFLRFVATITILISAIRAIFEPDVKKVVALSTLSQLGVIMLAISVGSVRVCFFHLVRHALFKALMFLCVGGVIHFSGVQDLRYIGGYLYRSPICMSWLVVASLSLIGFPFLSGFYSKDLVLESFLSGGIRIVLCVIVALSTCLTVLYRSYMLSRVFFSSIGPAYVGSCLSSKYARVPCRILGSGALFGGILMQSFVLEFNCFFSLFEIIKVVPLLCVCFGLFFFSIRVIWKLLNNFCVLNFNNKVRDYEFLNDILGKMWFMPLLSRDFFSGEVLDIRGDTKGLIEDGYLEFSFGGEGV